MHLLIVLICGLVSSSLLLRLGQLGVVGLLQCILIPAQPLLCSARTCPSEPRSTKAPKPGPGGHLWPMTAQPRSCSRLVCPARAGRALQRLSRNAWVESHPAHCSDDVGMRRQPWKLDHIGRMGLAAEPITQHWVHGQLYTKHSADCRCLGGAQGLLVPRSSIPQPKTLNSGTSHP